MWYGRMRGIWRAGRWVAADAVGHFNTDDGWAISSHVALSILMALFPFLLVVTAMAGLFGSVDLANEAAEILFRAWPDEVAAPIARQVHVVLTQPRGGIATFGVLILLFLAANGVEALRVALNRAYRMRESRPIWRLRAQSLAFTVIGALVLLALAFLLVLAPLMRMAAQHWAPWLMPALAAAEGWRMAVAVFIIMAGLIMVHLWLPDGRRRFRDIWPGVAFTLAFWLVGAQIFAAYLERFANYATTYAGLAGVMVALFFLYVLAAVFILGGELNAALARLKRRMGPSATGGDVPSLDV
jgi:membrane protein